MAVCCPAWPWRLGTLVREGFESLFLRFRYADRSGLKKVRRS